MQTLQIMLNAPIDYLETYGASGYDLVQPLHTVMIQRNGYGVSSAYLLVPLLVETNTAFWILWIYFCPLFTTTLRSSTTNGNDHRSKRTFLAATFRRGFSPKRVFSVFQVITNNLCATIDISPCAVASL